MPQFSFNSQGIDPQYGGGSPQLPLGKHPVVISATALKPTKDNQGGYLELTMDAIDGPAKGGSQIDRLNLQNKNADTVRIANQQLAAILAVIGMFKFDATEELHGKPFVVEIGPDKNNANQHRVIGVFDMQGNPPGQAGAGAQQQGGGFGGQPPAQGGGFGGQQGGGQQQGGGFQGGPADQSQQGGQQGGGAAPASQPGWAGGQQGGGQAQGGQGWNQGGGQQQQQQGGGQPGWGNR